MTALRNTLLAVIGIAGFSFMAYALVAGAAPIIEAVERPGAWLSLWRSVAAYASAMTIVGFGWWLLLRATGVAGPAGMAMAIFLLTQAAKYVPGNVAHVLGRVMLAQRAGIGTSQAATTVGIEVATISTAGALAGLYLVPQLFLSHGLLWQMAIAGACFLLFGLAVYFFLRIEISTPTWLYTLQTKMRYWVGIGRVIVQRKNLPFLVGYLLIVAAAFLLLGVFLQEAVQAIDPRNADRLDLMLATAAFAAAWMIGFITPGAPAGVGVREAALVLLLTPTIGREAGLAVAALSRVLSVVGDAVVALLGAGIYWLTRRAHAFVAVSKDGTS